MATVTVEIYSEKAIVVRNALEHHGQILQNMNGMFNERLKGGRGWIFPKYMLSQIRGVVEKLNSGQYGNEFEKKASSSAEPDTVSKNEFLSLLSRVERLEALVGHGAVPASVAAVAACDAEPPSLKRTSMQANQRVDIEFEDDDMEVEDRKPLSKPVRVVQNGLQSFSKPKKV
jgi:hypothetical protein